MSKGYAVSVVVIVVLIIAVIGWYVFLAPDSSLKKAEKQAAAARAKTAAEVKAKPHPVPSAQPGMVVDWKPEQSLPDSVKVQIVLDRDNRRETGTIDSWLAHAVFAYHGEKAKIEIDGAIDSTTLTWALWSKPGDEPNDQGSVYIKTREYFTAPTGQEVLIYEITRVETVRLTE